MEITKGENIYIASPHPPKPPRQVDGSMEITDEDNREKAHKALLEIWDALDLSTGGGIFDIKKHNDRYRLFHYFGESILGKDCPEKEMLC